MIPFIPHAPVFAPPTTPTDEPCWHCGGKAVEDPQQRVLCVECRTALFAPRFTGPILHDPITFWADKKNLSRCWRCATVEVDPADDLGLCGDCSEELRHG